MATVRKRRWMYDGETKTAWIADYFDSSGKRRQKTFTKKKDADAYLVTVAGEIRKGTHTPDSISKTVAKAGDLWLRQAERDGLEPSTTKAYGQHVKLHINPLIGKVKLSQLTAPGVNKFIRDLEADGRSEAMLRKVRGSLVSILSCAKEEGWVSDELVDAWRGQLRELVVDQW